MLKILIVIAFSFLLNIPFGILRARERKLSFKWFLYIHLPIPFIIALRIWLKCHLAWIPVFILAAVLGQWVGGRLKPSQPPAS